MSRPEWQRMPRRVVRSDAPGIMLVTGATGFIGRRLCRRLLADGHSVVALTRDAQHARDVFGSMVRVITSLDEILSSERIDVIVNLAGAPIIDRLWTPARRTELLDSRLSVTNKLTELIARLEHKPDVLINASAIGYYGVRGDEEITEAARGQPIFQSHLCQAWELAAQAAEEYDVRVCRLRFGIVLGMSGGTLPKLIPAARMRLRVVLGTGRQWQSWVHIDDLLDLLWFCIKQEDMSGGINVTSPQPVRQQEFAETLSAQFGRSIPVRVPAGILRATLGEMSQLLLEGQKVLPTKALSAGFAFRYPELKAALADLLRAKDPVKA
ncbi:hypothetical protein GCM10011487_05690 [Steroidobacter agaridevorans]|uniref:TIGR01777 family protein n=1 Tax=Steroidobacter agaridevorans TaxID=2695856 RepID=A0A829Y5S9_9GAMM|nr:TIGR01777 family oxidoreductase [Steroidobacter agaridevorans]GFE78569.1 hypothetical protein GCM10011487_05690 [Steroidobacter agaridevorans]GFE89498.1 hypothetical protein GCM10011488_44520 [Steroidobacter agaridevorans]